MVKIKQIFSVIWYTCDGRGTVDGGIEEHISYNYIDDQVINIIVRKYNSNTLLIGYS